MMDQFLLTCCTGNYKHFDKNQNILHLVLSLELWCLDMQIKVGWFPKRYVLVWTGIKLGRGTRRFQKPWVCSTGRCRSDSGAMQVWLRKGSLGKSIALLMGESQRPCSVPQHEVRFQKWTVCPLSSQVCGAEKASKHFPGPSYICVFAEGCKLCKWFLKEASSAPPGSLSNFLVLGSWVTCQGIGCISVGQMCQSKSAAFAWCCQIRSL